MSEEQNKQINIFLNSEKKKEQVFNNATSYEKYIIIQNETFQIKNKELEQNISRLETINENLEEDNNRMETGKRYTKNLLKNFAELDKLRVEVYKKTNNYYNYYFKKNKEKFNIKYYNIRYVQSFLSLFSITIFGDDEYSFQMFMNFINTILIIVFLEYIINEKVNLSNLQNEKEIIELNKEIKKITDSHDFIHDHIDNL